MNFDKIADRLQQFLTWQKPTSDLYRVSYWILIALIIGMFATAAGGECVILGLSALACGGLLGFLFGVPKVEQGEKKNSSDATASEYRQTVNTNLTEISNWLTKIIVGVSLVQMNQIPGAFQSLVQYLATPGNKPGMIGGVLVFFGVTGFLSGYLLTRLFLAAAFSEADRQASEFNRQSSTLELQLSPLDVPSPQDSPPEETTTEMGAALPTVNIESPSPSPTPPAPQVIKDVPIIAASPREAVLQCWGIIDELLNSIYAEAFPETPTPDSLRLRLTRLQRSGMLSNHELNIINSLRNLHRMAYTSSDAITVEAAERYLRSAQSVIHELQTRERRGDFHKKAPEGEAPAG